MLPTIFLSHGAPTPALSHGPTSEFLKSFAGQLAERPKAILVVSAHWETRIPAVNSVAVNDTIHDFGGFARELFEMRYEAPGAPWLAERIAQLLNAEGAQCAVDHKRGLDHGAWIPLKLMYPDADIPVVQLSLQTAQGPRYHLTLGSAIHTLREEGVLVIGSGSFTHDLSEFRMARNDGSNTEPGWVSDFANWLGDAIEGGRVDDLVNYRSLAPHARKNHPTEEHLLPLFVAIGAAGENAPIHRLHRGVTYSVLRMDAYAFGGAR